MSFGGSVASALKWFSIGRFAGQLMTWAITIVVMRVLSPDDYGLMALSMAIVSLVNLLNEMGLGASLVQAKTLDEETVSQAFGLLIVVNGAFFALLYVAAPAIAAWFAEVEVTGTLRVLASSFLFMPFIAVGSALLSREMRFKRRGLIEFTRGVVGSLLLLTLALAQFEVWALVFGFVANQGLLALAYASAIDRGLRPSFRLDRVRPMIAFSGWVLASRVVWHLYSQSNTFIIGKLLGAGAVGTYSVAAEVANLPANKVAGILNEVSFSAFSRIQEDPGLFRAAFLKGVRFLSTVSVPVFFGISAVAAELVPLLLGEKWNASILPLTVLALVVPLRMQSNMLAPALMGIGRPRVSFGNTIVGIVVMPAAGLVGVRWGVDGAAIAWTVAYPFAFVLMMWRSLPVLGIGRRAVLAASAPSLLAGAVMYGAVVALRAAVPPGALPHAAMLPLLAAAGGVVYVAGLAVLDRQVLPEILRFVRR